MFGSSLKKLICVQHEETMARHDEVMARHGEVMAKHEETMAKHEESMARHGETMIYLQSRDEQMKAEFKRRDEEMREFNREILRRNEKVYTAMIVQLEENTEETRASTRAVLSVLDRLDKAA